MKTEIENPFGPAAKDRARLDFLATFTGSRWAWLHLDTTGGLLTREEIDRRLATETQPNPKPILPGDLTGQNDNQK